ncbi:MAG: hypothetical protein OES57_08340 [Acidimicrobiia bacterium]|nr:hypothetical protein [Acidimicrobiia bacterium]
MPHRIERPAATSADAELVAPPLPAHPSAIAPFDPASTAAIVGIDDPLVRNAWITQRYHEQASRLTPYLGREHTYCTFARWRSAGVGQALAGADEGADVESSRLVRRIADHEATTHAWMAPLFDKLLDAMELGRTTSTDREVMLRRMGVMHDGTLARVAFGQYLSAVHDTDPVRRAQRVLAANLLLVWREQIELQQLLAPPVAVGRRWWRRSARVQRRDTVTSTVVDRVLLRVPQPGGTVDLTDGVAPEYPAALQVPSTSVLVEALDLWAPTDDGRDPATIELGRRMRALERLYRSGQHDHELAAAPFGRRQLEAMRRLEAPRVVAEAPRR